jgi:hypothetical protein
VLPRIRAQSKSKDGSSDVQSRSLGFRIESKLEMVTTW